MFGTITGVNSLTTPVIDIDGIVFPGIFARPKSVNQLQSQNLQWAKCSMRYDHWQQHTTLTPTLTPIPTKTAKWQDKAVPYKLKFDLGIDPTDSKSDNKNSSMLMSHQIATHHFHSDPDTSPDEYTEQICSQIITVADSKYDLVPLGLEQVANQQKHLNSNQQKIFTTSSRTLDLCSLV